MLGLQAPRGQLVAARREDAGRSPSLRCPRRCHDSGIAGGGGGGRLDCRLPGRLGVEGEGLGPKAQARDAQGQGAGSEVFPPALCLPEWKPCGRCPLAAFRVAGGGNEALLAAGGEWRPAQQPQSHCGAP